VPTARQSAAVEIKYDGALRIPDLETWHARVCGADGSPEPGDLAVFGDGVGRLVQQLDDLQVAFGEKAAALELPEPLQDLKLAAARAAATLENATAALVESERKRQSAAGQSETLDATVALAKATLTVQQAEARARAAHSDLARRCIAIDFAPKPLQELCAEIKRLQSV
jgi:hypothetical protein